MLKKKRALVLGGGGLRGLAHIGVLQELDKLNIHFDAIAGCSMGAIIGALYASGRTGDEIYNFVQNQKILSLFDFSISKLGISKTNKLKMVLEKFMACKTFKKLKIPLYVNATNLSQGREVVFSQGNIFKALRASISVPGFFAPLKVKKDLYIDGGVLNQTPFSILDSDIDQYLIINASPYHGLSGYKKITMSVLLDASLKLMQNEIINLRLKNISPSKKYLLLEPRLGNYALIEPSSKKQEIINKGSDVIKNNLKEIKTIFKI